MKIVASLFFFLNYWPISHPYPQDDFTVVMGQKLPDEFP